MDRRDFLKLCAISPAGFLLTLFDKNPADETANGIVFPFVFSERKDKTTSITITKFFAVLFPFCIKR